MEDDFWEEVDLDYEDYTSRKLLGELTELEKIYEKEKENGRTKSINYC